MPFVATILAALWLSCVQGACEHDGRKALGLRGRKHRKSAGQTSRRAGHRSDDTFIFSNALERMGMNAHDLRLDNKWFLDNDRSPAEEMWGPQQQELLEGDFALRAELQENALPHFKPLSDTGIRVRHQWHPKKEYGLPPLDRMPADLEEKLEAAEDVARILQDPQGDANAGGVWGTTVPASEWAKPVNGSSKRTRFDKDASDSATLSDHRSTSRTRLAPRPRERAGGEDANTAIEEKKEPADTERILRVDGARYGSVDDGWKSVDVTDEVNRLLRQNGFTNFTGGQSLNSLAGDPAEGKIKMLRVTKGSENVDILEQPSAANYNYNLGELRHLLDTTPSPDESRS